MREALRLCRRLKGLGLRTFSAFINVRWSRGDPRGFYLMRGCRATCRGVWACDPRPVFQPGRDQRIHLAASSCGAADGICRLDLVASWSARLPVLSTDTKAKGKAAGAAKAVKTSNLKRTHKVMPSVGIALPDAAPRRHFACGTTTTPRIRRPRPQRLSPSPPPSHTVWAPCAKSSHR